ncbi:MAG: glycosyltransferase family 2 protein [Victivallaceae bacterium]|nr:glycosyltransferase family 2 protein [Victivallaceae bacterium]
MKEFEISHGQSPGAGCRSAAVSGQEAAIMIDVVLATYNSSKYLRQQLDSLLGQDCHGFKILVRDGGSTDETPEIIMDYQRRYPGKIEFIRGGRSSVIENFAALLQASDAPLVMFCDHDDVWLPDKIGNTLAKYREIEERSNQGTPIMVFTDSYVADENLNVMDTSALRFQHLDPRHLSVNRLVLQNVPCGNTMLVNRALIELALPIPADAVMHDHWLTLVAAAFGKIGFLDRPTLYYRQHGGNYYGAVHYSPLSLLKKTTMGRRQIKYRFEADIRQAVAFGERYGERLSEHDREMISSLKTWDDCSFWRKRRILIKYGIMKSGFWRNAGMFLLV